MSDEARHLLDVWDVVRDHVPPQKREVVARGIVRAFADHGFDARDLADIKDEDEDLDAAFEAIFGDPEDENEEEIED